MRLFLVATATLLSATALLACPGPKVPKGPPPEYESPPPPSWLGDAGAAPATATPDASVVPGI